MTFGELERHLRESLARPLPGFEAQRLLAPQPRTPRPPTGTASHRDAAALLLTTQDQVIKTIETAADYGGSLDVILDDA